MKRAASQTLKEFADPRALCSMAIMFLTTYATAPGFAAFEGTDATDYRISGALCAASLVAFMASVEFNKVYSDLSAAEKPQPQKPQPVTLLKAAYHRASKPADWDSK